MLGVDRLDMIKGIPQKLLAVEKVLEEHPEWRERVLLVQIAVPTRTEVPEYQKLRSTVHEIVGRINGRYGTLTHVPIHHLDRSLSFNELVALYAVTDVALVTSLRDGMNLVSFEYVACQTNRAGVLILSEFAGAAQSLGAGSILVNPWNVNDMANAIDYALNMSDQERKERHRQNFNHVTTHTAQTWAETFISELNDTHVEYQLRRINIPPGLRVADASEAFGGCKKRLVVLGFNAALTCAIDAPRQPKRHFDHMRAMTKVHPSAFNILHTLSQSPDTTLVIFSGSGRARLEEVFGAMPVWLVAENGVFVRPGPVNGTMRREWLKMVDKMSLEWMESVQLVFDYFCERTPRSFVETRETSLVWNYKYADVEFGRLQARDLLQHLWTGPISNAPVDIIQGAKSVEVRPVGLSKGASMAKVLRLMAEMGGVRDLGYDFVACIGHFLGRDEDIFTLFEGTNNPVVFGRPLNHADPVAGEAGAVVGAPMGVSNEVARGMALPGVPAIDRALYPHEENSEAEAGSVHGRSVEGSLGQRSTEGDPAARGGVRMQRTQSHQAIAGRSPLAAHLDASPGGGSLGARSAHLASPGGGGALGPAREYEVMGGESDPGTGPGAGSRREARGSGFGASQGYVQRTYRANHSLRGSEPRGSAKEQSGTEAQRWAERIQRGGSPRASVDADRASEAAPALPMALPPPSLFTCTVGRQRSSARFLLMGSNEVASLLDCLAARTLGPGSAGGRGAAGARGERGGLSEAWGRGQREAEGRPGIATNWSSLSLVGGEGASAQ